MTNRASEGALDKNLNTEKVSTASPAVLKARTALEESALLVCTSRLKILTPWRKPSEATTDGYASEN